MISMEPNIQPIQQQAPLPPQNHEPNKLLVPLAIVAAGALVAGAIYFGGSSAPTVSNPKVTLDEVNFAPVSAQDHIVGSPNAKIVIIEYSDTECPFCKVFHNTMKTIRNTYGDKVTWVYRQLPIVQLHSRAPKEAEATECIADLAGNTAFWTYLDKIFTTTGSNDTLDPSLLPKFATEVGVSESAFNTCLNSGKYTEFVADSVKEGFKVVESILGPGRGGTPFSLVVVNNKLATTINGAEPIENVKAKIDALLK
jgi:protein-disulfide isomerase